MFIICSFNEQKYTVKYEEIEDWEKTDTFTMAFFVPTALVFYINPFMCVLSKPEEVL